MNNSIQIFNNPTFGEIRTAGTADNPLFCLSDVCEALGLTTSKVAQRLNKDVLSKYPLSTVGGEQLANFVNEDGLYDVILDSRKKSARAFRKWVTSEVLPSIRKTGGYMAATPEMSDAEIMARALNIAQATITKRDERIAEQQHLIEQKDARLELQEKELREAAPKVSFYDDVLQSRNTMTTTQVAKSMGMEANALNKKLRDIGIQYRQSGMWIVCAPYSRWKLHSVRTQTYTHSDGTLGTSQYTVWTNRGLRFIFALRDNEWNVRKAIRSINPDWGKDGKEVCAV